MDDGEGDEGGWRGSYGRRRGQQWKVEKEMMKDGKHNDGG